MTTGLFRELIRRRVPAILAIYAGTAAALLEGIDDLGPALGWDDRAFESALIILSFGFLNAAIAAWHHGAEEDQLWRRRELLFHAAVVGTAFITLSVLVLPYDERGTERNSGLIGCSVFETAPGKALDRSVADSVMTKLVGRILAHSTLRVTFSAGEAPAYLLSGSVRSDKSRLRISAELADAGTGIRMWNRMIEVDGDEADTDVIGAASTLAADIVSVITARLADE